MGISRGGADPAHADSTIDKTARLQAILAILNRYLGNELTQNTQNSGT